MTIRTLNKLRIGHFLVAGVLSLFPAPGVLDCRAADLPAPSGKFTFDGKPYIGTATLTNAPVTNASLFLNGVYYSAGEKPYTAIFTPSIFRYERFTTVVKLRPEKGVSGLSGEWAAFRDRPVGRWYGASVACVVERPERKG